MNLDSVPEIKEEVLNEALEKLNNLDNIESVKNSVDEIVNFARINHVRKSRGLPTPERANNLLFVDNHGVDKMAVAKIITDIYYALNIIKENKLTVIKAEDVLSGSGKDNANIIKSVIEDDFNGILYVEDAYKLNCDSGNDVLSVLAVTMQTEFKHIAVIFTGDQENLDKFLTQFNVLSQFFVQRLRFS